MLRFLLVLLLTVLSSTAGVNAQSRYFRRNVQTGVQWSRWSEATLAKAKREAKPLFVTIGAASCHPCHVLERDAFSNAETAALLNTYFVPLLIDRDEHPELDAAFATMAQSYEWPKVAILTPNLEPILVAVAPSAAEVSRQLVIQSNRWTNARVSVTAEAALNLVKVHGLPAVAIPTRATDDEALRTLALTPEHDQLGGGFHRDATHYEKLLPEQAMLAHAYLDAWQRTKDARFADVARGALDYIVRDLAFPDTMVFQASQDSDSLVPRQGPELVRGVFYEWTRDEIRRLLGDQAGKAIRYYGIAEEGSSVPYVAAPDLADDYREELAAARALLLDVRLKRPAPFRDEKIVAGWNGLTIGALARAGVLFNEPRYLDAARAAARYITTHHWNAKTKTLSRSQGVSALDEDYALLVRGLVELSDATLESGWLELAKAIHAQSGRATTALPVQWRDIPNARPKAVPARIPERQVVLAGDPFRDDTRAFVRTAFERRDRDFVLVRATKEFLKGTHLEVATAWVCQGGTCGPPTADPSALAKLLD
ncbi:MAG TPA: DUF255 domain-containing protein [Thermoanaerobaculia bacterium]